jgi:hypothetical protein
MSYIRLVLVKNRSGGLRGRLEKPGQHLILFFGKLLEGALTRYLRRAVHNGSLQLRF